jgi:hypothetical protein
MQVAVEPAHVYHIVLVEGVARRVDSALVVDTVLVVDIVLVVDTAHTVDIFLVVAAPLMNLFNIVN